MTASPSGRPRTAGSSLGVLLREGRAARRLSQLDLALEAGISARHLSFVETGKAQPSREMIARLARALGLSLRDHNALLVAAGFAPGYPETPLRTPDLAPVQRAIDLILAHQEPYPAFVIDRYWDVLLTNQAVPRLFGWLRGGIKHGNIMRQVFDPEDVRPALANWEEVAADLIGHLHDAVRAAPADVRMRSLLEEVLRYPGVPADWRSSEPGARATPLFTGVFRKDGEELRFFSTLTTFGAPRDVTLEELHIECFFPADQATAERCERLAREA